MNTSTSSSPSLPGGTWALGDLTVTRFGYGAMQLAGPGVMGPPADRDGALAVLREAAGLGITHIDTAGAYGPRVTNRLIREALHPYPASLHIVTKVGAVRDEQGGWIPARTPEDVRRAVLENLEDLGLDALDVVNLRLGDARAPVSARSPSPSRRWPHSSGRASSGTSASATRSPNRSPRRGRSRPSCACRTCTTSPTGRTTG
jgi:hypothetical protein